jgi:serine/threonine protein kinase
MPHHLHVTTGPDKGRKFPLSPGETLQVGRSQTTPTRLTDPSVSKIHFQLEVGEDQAMLQAISKHGTYVNGQNVTQHAVKHGDIIRIGSTELQYVGDSEASTMEPTPAQKLAPAAAAAKPLPALVGQTLGHFAIDALIAKGASGAVFRVRDTKDGQVLALKVLHPEFSTNDDEMKRFIRAMKTVLPLRHPNLVALYGAGRAGPYCWIAMEYVDGESMTQVIRRIGVAGMLDWRIAYGVAVHIGRALEYAHENSIIHRNVMPANILLRNGDKVAKLGDLMLAKALEGTLAQQITKPGELVGDIAYMAPERTRGTADVDGRADLYGLGATLYALLTGRPPFTADAMPDLIAKIRTTEPEKPKKYQLSIPDMLQGTVLRLLAKRPEERYQTAQELLTDLERTGKFTGVNV